MRGVDSVDVANRRIWFRASGVNPEQDPYFVHYYRIDFDGTGLVAYTEADGMHEVTFSPDRRYYVDRWSRGGSAANRGAAQSLRQVAGHGAGAGRTLRRFSPRGGGTPRSSWPRAGTR